MKSADPSPKSKSPIKGQKMRKNEPAQSSHGPKIGGKPMAQRVKGKRG